VLWKYVGNCLPRLGVAPCAGEDDSSPHCSFGIAAQCRGGDLEVSRSLVGCSSGWCGLPCDHTGFEERVPN